MQRLVHCLPIDFALSNKLTMKVASTLVLVTFCATAVSAFGLNHGVRSGIQTAKKGGFPLVKPIDLQGNRLNTVVSANIIW